MLLTRYPGYTAAEIMQQDFHLTEALLDIALAANEKGADEI